MEQRLAAEGPVNLGAEPDFNLGHASIKPSLCEIHIGGSAIGLEPRVMQVLVLLAKANGGVVSRAELMDRCWSGRIVGDDALNRAMLKLRKIPWRRSRPAFRIGTVPKVGYRLTTEVAASRPRPTTIVALAVAALAVIAGVGFWALSQQGPGARPRIEVQALRAIGPVGATDFAEQLHEDLVDVLNQSSVQTTASDRPRWFGKRVDLVLKGSVSREGNRLAVRIFLDDARAGQTLWSGRFEQLATSSQLLADEVTAAATETIYTALELSVQQRQQLDPAILALYIHGSELLRSPQSSRSGEPRQAFEQVVARAPGMAAGHAKLALTLVNEARRGPVASRPVLLKLAQQEAARAIAIDPASSGAAYDALYFTLRTQSPARLIEAEDLVLDGLRHAPAFPFLNMRECRLLAEVGRAREAMAHCHRALALRPLAGPIGYTYATTLSIAGEDLLAHHAIERAARRNPDHGSTRRARVEMAAFGESPATAVLLLRDPATRPIELTREGAAAMQAYLKARQSGQIDDVQQALIALRAAARDGRVGIEWAVMAAVMLDKTDDAYAFMEGSGLGSVDEVPDPKSGGGDEYEADVAVGGLVVTGGQSAAVLEL